MVQHSETAAQTGTIVGLESPQELQKMSIEQLNELAVNIRSYIISVVSQNGGHLSSNLGVVELTIALHYCFDFSKDRLVFDVGHQSYVHKLLTGRAPQFPTLRTKGGISGFPKRSESEYDAFNVGHSSTAISAALGMLRAMRLKGDFESRAVALVGDGALTGGLAYEAMDDAGEKELPLIVVLNDNSAARSMITISITDGNPSVTSPRIWIPFTVPSAFWNAAMFGSVPLKITAPTIIAT